MGRKKLNRIKVQVRINEGTHEKIKEISKKLGYTYSEEGAIGQMLDAIADGELILIQRKIIDVAQ